MSAVSITDIMEGDERAFEQAYYHWHQKLYAYFLNKTGTAAVSEELVQICFIKLWRYRNQLNPEMSLDIQLFRIAKTSAIDVLRQQARNRVVAWVEEDMEQLPNPVQEQTRAEKISFLQHYLPALSPMRRKIMEYRLAGLSNHEIASSLALSPKTVENQINRAVRELRKKLNVPAIIILLAVHQHLY